MKEKLIQTIKEIERIKISESRKKKLNEIKAYLKLKINKNLPVYVNFICTHNSRRSQLAQVWMQTFAYHFNFKNIFCFSSGTEISEVAPQVISALKKQGFEIDKVNNNTNNPQYKIITDKNNPHIILHSKKYEEISNSKFNFLAIMVCNQADQNCPVVLGAEKKLALTYEDPKKFDNSEEEELKYSQKSLEIASEVYYVLSTLK